MSGQTHHQKAARRALAAARMRLRPSLGQETVSDFKARLAAIMRERDTGKRFSVIGGPRAHESVVRR
jgi:hypothetical protein